MKFMRDLLRLVLFTAVIMVLMAIADGLWDKLHFSMMSWMAPLYYLLLTAITGLITGSGLKKDNKSFMTRTYASIGLRLVFSVFPLFIYLFTVGADDLDFIILFILLYFFYTSFEIYSLVVNLRPDSKK